MKLPLSSMVFVAVWFFFVLPVAGAKNVEDAHEIIIITTTSEDLIEEQLETTVTSSPDDDDGDFDDDDDDRLLDAASADSLNERRSSGDELEVSESTIRRLWVAHGACAFMAWAILVPLAVSSSLLRKFLEQSFGISWFPIHRGFNLAAIFLTVVAVTLAVTAYSLDDDDDDAHFVDEPHHTVGLIILLASLFQGINGLFRPHLPPSPPPPAAETDDDDDDEGSEPSPRTRNDPPGDHADDPSFTIASGGGSVDDNAEPASTNASASDGSTSSSNQQSPSGCGGDPASTIPTSTTNNNKEPENETKSSIRVCWEYLHRSWGVLLLATTWWQIQSGLDHFADEFDGSRDLRPVFWTVIVSIVGVVGLIFLYQTVALRRNNTR